MMAVTQSDLYMRLMDTLQGKDSSNRYRIGLSFRILGDSFWNYWGLGYRFLDSDLVIQEQTKKLLHELSTEHGVDGFLKIEEDINAGLDCEQAVIATGGSVIYGEKAMETAKAR